MGIGASGAGEWQPSLAATEGSSSRRMMPKTMPFLPTAGYARLLKSLIAASMRASSMADALARRGVTAA
jgi:hypothetical protein